nr:LysR family transcriptional regulator [Pseudomonas brassicacearum subsp. brassicacearum]
MDCCAMSTNLPLPLLAEMAIFVKVVETGSFSEAARQSGSSPSAISRSISRLEKALATRLLQRTTRKLRLSDGGEEVFKRCQEMVAAARSVMEISGQFTQEAEGRIRVSVPKAVGRFVIHPHMPEFLRRYPKVDVELFLEDRQVDLIDDHVDLAIRITDQPPVGLVGRQLLTIDHLLCATPQYLAEHGTPTHPHDLLEHSCIYLGVTPNDARWKFKKGSKSVTVGVHGRYAANHTGVRLGGRLAAHRHWQPAVLHRPPCLGARLDRAGIGRLDVPGFLSRWLVVAAFPDSLPAAQAAGVH